MSLVLLSPHISSYMGISGKHLPALHKNLLRLQLPASNGMGYRSVGQKIEQQRMPRIHHDLAPHQGQLLEIVSVKEYFFKNKRCYISLKGYFMASVLPLRNVIISPHANVLICFQ